MRLTEIRKTVRLSMGAEDGEYSDADIDRGIRLCLNEFQRVLRFQRSVSVVVVTAGNAEFSVSATDFRPERVLLIERVYNDRSTWADSTSYAVDDLVQGDGDPDSYLYVCIHPHTSSSLNEPPNESYWVRVPWKRGQTVDQVGFDLISDWMVGARPWTGEDACRPMYVGWSPDGKGYVWPVPTSNVRLSVTYANPLPEWTPGTQAMVDLEIPDEYIDPMVWFGVPAALMYRTEGQRVMSDQWNRFKTAILEIKGYSDPDAGPTVMNPVRY